MSPDWRDMAVWAMAFLVAGLVIGGVLLSLISAA